MSETVVVVVGGALALAGGFGVVFQRNPVYAALSLAASMFGVAVVFLSQGAEFLAAVQLVVYAGAVVVLFLFVLMFLGIDVRERLEESLPFQRGLGIPLALCFAATLLALALLAGATATYFGPLRQFEHESNVGQLAELLFSEFLYPFELTSVLVVAAAVAAVVLAKEYRSPRVERGDGVSGSDQPRAEGRP